MLELNFSITISSFIAGIFTFFAPCTLPLVPAFLGIISGTNPEELKNPEMAKAVRGRIFKNAVLYVIGFSLVFILFGVSFSFVSHILGLKEWIQRFGGVVVVIFGLFMMGWIKLPFLSYEKQIRVPQLFRHVSLLNSFLLGALFALGWSPCVGPLLGSVLLLTSTSSTIIEGTFLLIIFSAGLGLPFLITSLFVGNALTVFGKWGRMLEVINKIAGVFLIFLGLLLMFNKFAEFHNQLILYFYKFPTFEVFVNKFL